ncbi:MAG TPA: ribosome biogenesis GTPase Der [Verrucomicrobia bacterium]|nr:ribosome biogenesis GTPase Der [Verrucomicrobiota bacterium]
MSEEIKQRVVAIVGRPNVGKSALFNRLVGRRLAIVHQESGVTRDRLICETMYKGERFDLIDTGGLAQIDGAKTDLVFAEQTRRQVEVAIEDAAVVLFVVDIHEGLVPMDREVQRLLKKSGRKVFLVANKADTLREDTLAPEFEALGFPVFPVSASHKRGIEPLMAAVLPELPPAPPFEAKDVLKVAVVGRPNVGKSSYINCLLGHERVIVSDVPGTTRDSIEIPFTVGKGPQARHYLLIDTAGMRKAGHVRNSVEKFSLFRAQRSVENADVVILIIDAEQGPTEQDKKVAALIMDNRRGCILLVNKWDLAEDTVKEKAYMEALRRQLFFLEYVPIIFASAKSGYNIKKSIETIDYVAGQIKMHFSTGVLNRVIHDAFDRFQPPATHGRRLKFYYATQTGENPIRIQLFVNDPTRCTPTYQSFLLNFLRKHFGLEGAPIVLVFKSSHEKKDEDGDGREQ